MGREELDRDDARTTRSMRTPGGSDRRADEGSRYGDPVRPDWLSSRASGRSRRSRNVPTSRQEFVMWLQSGGWLTMAIVFGFAFAAIAAIILFGQSRPLATGPTATPIAQIDPQILPLQASVTPAPITTTLDLSGGGGGGAQFRVSGTDTEGLFLRPNPNTDGAPIKTLPEGTVVTKIGENYVGPDRVWMNVRDTEGSEGWVASEFLQPAQ